MTMTSITMIIEVTISPAIYPVRGTVSVEEGDSCANELFVVFTTAKNILMNYIDEYIRHCLTVIREIYSGSLGCINKHSGTGHVIFHFFLVEAE